MAQGKSFEMNEEFASLDFHSRETLKKQPDASIWEASGNRAESSD